MSYFGARCLYGLLEIEAYHGGGGCGVDREIKTAAKMEQEGLRELAFLAKTQGCPLKSVKHRRGRKTTELLVFIYTTTIGRGEGLIES